MSKRGIYLTNGTAYYDGKDPAARYATHRANLTLEFLRGDDKTKARIARKIINEENRKPPTHAKITGLKKLPIG